MADFNKKFNSIFSELDKNINDPKELEYVKNKMLELMAAFASSMDRIEEIEEKQSKTESKLKKIERELDRIEDDIYIEEDDDEDFGCDQMHDNDYEFEIVCPYCDNDFVLDEYSKYADAIECPKCHKEIELDWNESEECTGSCESCGSHCYHENETNQSNQVAEGNTKYSADNEKKDNKNKQDNEDDM